MVPPPTAYWHPSNQIVRIPNATIIMPDPRGPERVDKIVNAVHFPPFDKSKLQQLDRHVSIYEVHSGHSPYDAWP